MSADGPSPSAMATSEPEQRRGSVSRTLSRIKNAMKRRSSGFGSGSGHGPRLSVTHHTSPTQTAGNESTVPAEANDTPLLSTVPAAPELAPEVAPIADATVPALASAVELPQEEVPTSIPETTAQQPPILNGSDQILEAGDGDEPFPPSSFFKHPVRSVRAREALDRYGIRYEEAVKDLPDGRRHVQKAIRIRIHWQCHECKSSFGSSKTCTRCSHYRCPHCVRTPTKRIREMLGGTTAMQEIEKKAANASPEKDAVVVPVAIGGDAAAAAPVVQPPASPPTGASPPANVVLEGVMTKEERTAEGDVDVRQSQYKVRHNAHGRVQLLLRPRREYVKATCHECSTHFTPASRYNCLTCGHERCKRCPSEFIPPDERPAPRASEDGPPPLDRVYRKPRQRVRWSCDQCQTMFLASKSCLSCGHERCATCTRSPLKRVPAQPDATLVAALAERLANTPAVPAAG